MRRFAIFVFVTAAAIAGAASQDRREYVFSVPGSSRGLDMAVDGGGSVYVTGETNAPDFPTTSRAYDRSCGTDGKCDGTGEGKYAVPRKRDAFVTRIAADGTVSYSTYFGGPGEDTGAGIAVDALGRAHIIVDTDFVNGARGLPISTALGPGCGKSPPPPGAYGIPRDVIVVRFNAQGSDIEYATCIGGTRDDYPQAIAVEDDGSVYVTGRTDSTDFPLVHPLQPVHRGRYDVFVAKLDSSGRTLAYSTYLGGTGSDVGNGLALDRDGNLHVLGYSSSPDFPLVRAQQTENRGESDIVLVKLDRHGRLMLFSTYLGTEAFDHAQALATDRLGNVFVVGATGSKSFPVTEGAVGGTCALSRIPWLSSMCSWDAFLFSVDPLGRLRYSTYLGGADMDQGLDVAVDPDGRVLVAGETQSSDFPGMTPALRLEPGERVAFVARVGPFASALTEVRPVPHVSPYGAHTRSIGVDGRGRVYVMGANIGSIGLFVASVP